jgi:bacterioferritin-associated ferredoxin
VVIVCICRGVSDRQVRLAVLQGAASLNQVTAMCDAGGDCGSCHEQIQEMLGADGQPANDNRPCAEERGQGGCARGLSLE